MLRLCPFPPQAALANLPVWNRQFSVRGLAVGVVLGGVFCIVTHKLSLTLGIIPSLNVSARPWLLECDGPADVAPA